VLLEKNSASVMSPGEGEAAQREAVGQSGARIGEKTLGRLDENDSRKHKNP